MLPVSLLFHDVFVSDPNESGFNSPAAGRYKLSVDEFDSQISGLARASGEAAKADAACLTFDDGGGSFYAIVADKLEARGLRAHCFVTTDFIGRTGFLDAPQIRELDARGHVIGTHSASHPTRFSALSRTDMRSEWIESRQRLEDVLGHGVTTGSVPGGYFSRDVGRTAAQSGLLLLFNSEPVRSARLIDGCIVAGRFTIRAGAPPDLARRFVQNASWARSKEWATWNAKALVKPVLGSSYPRVADWIYGGVR
jgi:peptidoglycan/xylan/chitin deacetylase (PgdA/CDA1 family)